MNWPARRQEVGCPTEDRGQTSNIINQQQIEESIREEYSSLSCRGERAGCVLYHGHHEEEVGSVGKQTGNRGFARADVFSFRPMQQTDATLGLALWHTVIYLILKLSAALFFFLVLARVIGRFQQQPGK